MSSITARKQENRTTCYQFTCTDDEIIDDNFLQLSDDSETWLYTSELQSGRKSFINGRLDYGQDGGVLDSSCRFFDSRTYTRRKRCSVQPSLESCWESPTPNNTTHRSSLGILTPSLNNRSQDLMEDILEFTPIVKHHPERDSLGCTGSETTGPKHFQLDLSSLTPAFSNLQRKPIVLNTTFNKSHADIISDITAPSFSNINTPESSLHNSLTMAASTESLDNQTDINNMTNLSKEILHCTYEAENIAPAVNMNTTDKPFNLTKTNLNTTQTIFSKTKSPNTQVNGTANITKMNAQVNTHKSPLNTTFPKSTNDIFSKTLNNTFTKSVDALNGVAEDDQISSASDSSFSSCSNLPRSVGDLHIIARLQEESLDEPDPERNNSTPKLNNMPRTPINGNAEQHVSTPKTAHGARRLSDDLFCEESISPITKSGDDGSKSFRNNIKSIPHPITSLMGDHKSQISVNGGNATITRPKVTSRLTMPVAVSQMPVSRMIRPPAVRNVGTVIRPTAVSATSIPRPASRLPCPRFRGRAIPKPK